MHLHAHRGAASRTVTTTTSLELCMLYDALWGFASEFNKLPMSVCVCVCLVGSWGGHHNRVPMSTCKGQGFLGRRITMHFPQVSVVGQITASVVSNEVSKESPFALAGVHLLSWSSNSYEVGFGWTHRPTFQSSEIHLRYFVAQYTPV